jgi:hypothetical protein
MDVFYFINKNYWLNCGCWIYSEINHKAVMVELIIFQYLTYSWKAYQDHIYLRSLVIQSREEGAIRKQVESLDER